jgi:hypothetical protein
MRQLRERREDRLSILLPERGQPDAALHKAGDPVGLLLLGGNEARARAAAASQVLRLCVSAASIADVPDRKQVSLIWLLMSLNCEQAS